MVDEINIVVKREKAFIDKCPECARENPMYFITVGNQILCCDKCGNPKFLECFSSTYSTHCPNRNGEARSCTHPDNPTSICDEDNCPLKEAHK